MTTTEVKETMTVNANYEVLATKKSVLVRVPKAGDPNLRWINAHHIVSLDGPYLVEEHYRRGEFTKRKKTTKKNEPIFITRRFFFGPEYLGRTILATVKVVKKIDRHQGEQFCILDIYPDLEETGTVSCELKFQTELTEEEFKASDQNNTFLIPGTTHEYKDENGLTKKVDEYIVFVER